MISHRLANRLIDEGFSVWINSNQLIEFDQILRKINQSDCIILCISRNYFQDELCKKEAKYAEQIGKFIIPVKVEYYQPIEWLQKLIEKDSYFQLFGSDNHFNLEYEKLLLKIVSFSETNSSNSNNKRSRLIFWRKHLTQRVKNIGRFEIFSKICVKKKQNFRRLWGGLPRVVETPL
jgi:hypothetical protein